MNPPTYRERQDLNTQKNKLEADANNQGNEPGGREAGTDEDKTDLQNKTGNKLDHTQEGQGHKTKARNEQTKGAHHGRSRPGHVQQDPLVISPRLLLLGIYNLRPQRSKIPGH